MRCYDYVAVVVILGNGENSGIVKLYAVRGIVKLYAVRGIVKLYIARNMFGRYYRNGNTKRYGLQYLVKLEVGQMILICKLPEL